MIGIQGEFHKMEESLSVDCAAVAQGRENGVGFPPASVVSNLLNSPESQTDEFVQSGSGGAGFLPKVHSLLASSEPPLGFATEILHKL